MALNAIQAMDGGGGLSITSRWLHVEGEVMVLFSDTGKGMRPEVLDKAFTPFFTTRHDGTGLGLYVAKEVIEQQGGTIAVESSPGQGTMVAIRLPVGESALLHPET